MEEFLDYLENTTNVKNRSNASCFTTCKYQEALLEMFHSETAQNGDLKSCLIVYWVCKPTKTWQSDEAFKVILIHPQLLALPIRCIIYMCMLQG